MKKLEGKVAIITGSNSGVGAYAAELFAKEGAKVAISARRLEPLQTVAEKIISSGGEVLIVQTDISKPNDVENLMKKTVEKFGKIDILVNNAGVLDKDLNGIDRVDYEDFDKVLNINEKGTIYCINKAIPHLAEGGSIINIASVAGVNGGGGAAYVASKAAIIGITKHTALKFAKDKIRCNVICPGMIITPMNATLNQETMDQKLMGAMMQHSDLSLTPCLPEDISNIALFLGSDDSRSITGQVLVADFGANL